MKKYRVTIFTTATFTWNVDAESPQEAVKIVEEKADPTGAQDFVPDDGPYESFIVDPIDASGKILHDDPEYDTHILTPEFRRERASGKMLEVLKQLRSLRDQWRSDDRFTSIDYMDEIDRIPFEEAIAEAEGP
jgi:hypothetical protein